MTLEEARKLACIAGRAGLSEDGPDETAVGNTVDDLNHAFGA